MLATIHLLLRIPHALFLLRPQLILRELQLSGQALRVIDIFQHREEFCSVALSSNVCVPNTGHGVAI